jgi:hypothetical protein
VGVPVSKPTIAPALVRIASLAPVDWGVTRDEWDAARRELRSLLAAVRAARKLVYEDPESPGDLLVNGGDWEMLRALDRALARLSPGRTGRKGKR